MARRKKKVEEKPEPKPEPAKELYSVFNGRVWIEGRKLTNYKHIIGAKTARYVLVDIGTINQQYEPD